MAILTHSCTASVAALPASQSADADAHLHVAFLRAEVADEQEVSPAGPIH